VSRQTSTGVPNVNAERDVRDDVRRRVVSLARTGHNEAEILEQLVQREGLPLGDVDAVLEKETRRQAKGCLIAAVTVPGFFALVVLLISAGGVGETLAVWLVVGLGALILVGTVVATVVGVAIGPVRALRTLRAKRKGEPEPDSLVAD
jgi:Flp pilus assembly protein TadB